MEELLTSDWIKFKEALQHNSELLGGESPDELGQIVREVLADVIAFHHVDCEADKVHILHLWVCVEDLLGHVEGRFLYGEIDFKALKHKVREHEDQLKIAHIHVAEICSRAEVLKELLEVVNRAVINLVFLDAEEAAHQGDSDSIEGCRSVLHVQILQKVESGEAGASVV